MNYVGLKDDIMTMLAGGMVMLVELKYNKFADTAIK